MVDLYTSAFCGACHSARATLAEAARLVPAARIREFDVAFNADRAEAEDIASTPTIIIRSDDGVPVFRAAGAPSLAQLLSALATAV